MHLVVARGLGLLRARLEAADALRGKRVRNDSGDEGIAAGIDDEGRLVVRSTDGAVMRWTSNEIHMV
jgi:biotin-(acetyl-CoA carboxylase) ligase